MDTDTIPHRKIFANHFGSPPPRAQADDGFANMMGTKMEDFVTVPFMTVLDFADNVALEYDKANNYLIHHEEERLSVARKDIEICQYPEREISGPYFQGHHE
jgi:hypothetical protein